MGNTAPRAGLKPHLWHFGQVCYRCTTQPSLMPPLSPCPPVYAAPCLRGQCSLLHLCSWNCNLFNAYDYMRTGNGLTYIYTWQVQQPYSVQLVHDPGPGTSVVGETKIGNTARDSNPYLWHCGPVCYHCTIQAFLMSPLCPHPPVYAAPCLSGQSSLLCHTYVTLLPGTQNVIVSVSIKQT